MKRIFFQTALTALFIAPFAFSNAFAACAADAKSECLCSTDCCNHHADNKTHKCKKECKCRCCADKATIQK